VELTWLIPMLMGLLLLFLLVQFFLPKHEDPRNSADDKEDESSQSVRENLKLIAGSRHLKIIASIVFIATMAGTLVDYQFKDFARVAYDADADLAGFFGAFYGWTGGIALFVQLVLASRLMSTLGVSGVLSTLGTINMLGAFGVMLVPGLASVTALRGANNSFRSSLYRPTLEFLYVPIPAELRRKTKSFIDTVVDSGGEGVGAVIVFSLVTLGGIQSRFLGLAVAVLAGVFIGLSRRMGTQYFDTIVQRLKVGEEELEKSSDDPRRGLLSATFSRIELQSVMIDAGMLVTARGKEKTPSMPLETQDVPVTGSVQPLEERLKSSDHRVVEAALEEVEEWDDATVAAVVRLLARDVLLEKVVAKVTACSEACLPQLIECLRDENTDFVIRRRIPRALDRIDSVDVVEVLLDALTANRFEVRYRSAIALARKQRRDSAWSRRDWKALVWQAIRSEVGRGRPVWELQKLLDGFDSGTDDLVEDRVGARGELSLEHTFRLLSLVLDPKPVRASFHGILYGDQSLISFALEYLEQVLPTDVRKRLWLLIGDMSEYQKSRAIRPLDKVVEELVGTHATLFAGDLERDALRKMLEDRTEKESGP
jgi:HEAT repeat protein